MQDVKD